MAKATCSVLVCDRQVLARGWCRGHYNRWHKTGDPGSDVIPPKRTRVGCSVAKCLNLAFTYGMCATHRYRVKVHGDPLAHAPVQVNWRRTPRCAVEGCRHLRTGDEWCDVHYQSWLKHGDPGPAVKPGPRPTIKKCSAPTCHRDSRRHNLCGTHDERLQRWGDIREDLPFGRKPRKPCIEPDCLAGAKSRGLCSKHYAALQRAEIKADPARFAKWQETARQCGLRWREANKERSRQYQRLYRINNPAKTRADDRRRYEKFKAAFHVPFTYEQLMARMAYWGNRCWMCGGPFETIDHVKPINKGGAHVLSNLRAACRSCNPRKRDKWPYPTRVTLHIIPLP